jgi:hypothetical protein
VTESIREGERVPLLERLQNIKWRHAVIAAVVLLLGALLFGVIAFAGNSTERSASAAAAGAPARVGSPVDPGSTRPPDDPARAPNDDPAADSAYGIEAQKLLDELRSHDVPFTDADANILVDIGDRNVARGVPDLAADDPMIADQVVKAFPQYTDQQRADVVRCLAEFVERTVAANRGTVPPDEDDHTG